MRVEVKGFDGSSMAFINLNHLPGSNIIEFDLLVVRAGGSNIPQRVELGLMNHPRMFLVLLDYFFSGNIPDENCPIIARNQAFGNGRKLSIPHPVLMLLVLPHQPPIDCRPYLYVFIVACRNQQLPIARVVDAPYLGVVSLC